MNARYAFDSTYLVDNINAKLDAFLRHLFLRHPLKPGNGSIGHIHSGNPRLHISCGTHRLYRSNTGKYLYLLMQSFVPYHLHPFSEFIHIVNNLGLDEICPRGHFLSKTRHSELKRISKRISSGPDEDMRLNWHFLATLKLLFVPHTFHHPNQLDRVKVVNAFSSRMIAEFLMVPRETQHVIYAQCRDT